jgi:threonine dehydratase
MPDDSASLPTPLEPAPASLFPGRRLLLKREDLHELGAFKWRGALAALSAYGGRGPAAVVTASTGNHGAATAWAARRLGTTAIVFTPHEVSRTKLALIEAQGASIRRAGADMDEAKDEARAFAASRGLPFFEDGAEPAQYVGYAAIGEEILDQCPGLPAAVVVAVGNGALLGGIGAALKRRAPATLRVGVVAKEAPVMALSHEAEKPVPCDRSATFADGLAVRVAIPLAVARLREVADRMLRVSERELAAAVADYSRAGIRVEGAAAAALAAIPQLGDVGDPVVLVVTGRNIDGTLLERALRRPESFPA